MVNAAWGAIPEFAAEVVVGKTMSLVVAAAAYNVFTAATDCLVLGAQFYNRTAAAGLTSLHVDTDDTEARALLSSTLLAALTGGKNLTPYTTSFVLSKGSHIVLTTVGTGTAGDLVVAVRYVPIGLNINGQRLS